LGSMAAKLTYGVRRFEAVDRQIRSIIPVLHNAAMQLIPMIDADTTAFKDYMEGVRMPQDTAKAKQARFEKMQQGLKTAVKVPLNTMRIGNAAWTAMCDVARYGNPASRSDIEVGARSLETGIWGAYRNVVINLAGIKDETYRQETLVAAGQLTERAARKCAEVLNILDQA
jgi:glutamate formiminotransferase/formiminotetrahydrofolate cyclodeaminase